MKTFLTLSVAAATILFCNSKPIKKDKYKVLAYEDAANLLDFEPYFTLDASTLFDLAYGFNYNVSDSENKDWHYESYSFHLFSIIQYAFKMRFLDFYELKYTFNIELFDLSPYKQMVGWLRPNRVNSGEDRPFDFIFEGSYMIKGPAIRTSISENVRTMFFSLSDFIFEDAQIYPSQWEDIPIDGENAVEFDDEYWSYDLLELAGYDIDQWTWYGKWQSYFVQYLLGNYRIVENQNSESTEVQDEDDALIE